MDSKKAIKLFNDQKIRVEWNDEEEKWYFSIVDVVGVLAGNDRPRTYWSDLKRKLKEEGSQLSEKIGRLKMPAADGKMRLTDVADTEQLLRIVQSIPRDNMSNLELILNMLAEATTTEISKEKNPSDFNESKKIAKQGGTVAGNTRKEIEERTGKPVVTSQNAQDLLDKAENEELGDGEE